MILFPAKLTNKCVAMCDFVEIQNITTKNNNYDMHPNRPNWHSHTILIIEGGTMQ